MASVAYADPTLQMVSAPRLTAADVPSFSGRTSYLIANMEIARKAGARILSISPGGSVVASLADENINLNAYRTSSQPLIVPTGRAPIDVTLNVLFRVVGAEMRHSYRNVSHAAMNGKTKQIPRLSNAPEAQYRLSLSSLVAAWRAVSSGNGTSFRIENSRKKESGRDNVGIINLNFQ